MKPGLFVIAKGSFLFLGTVAITLASSLAQWANSGDAPSTITWVIIIAGCIGTGSNQVVSFLSESFSQWKATKSTDTQFSRNRLNKTNNK